MPSTSQVVKNILANEGPSGFYRGLSAGLFRQVRTTQRDAEKLRTGALRRWLKLKALLVSLGANGRGGGVSGGHQLQSAWRRHLTN